MRTTIISLLFASLVFSGCAAQSAAEGEDDFVASEAEAITAPERAPYCSGDYHEWVKKNCKTEFVY